MWKYRYIEKMEDESGITDESCDEESMPRVVAGQRLVM